MAEDLFEKHGVTSHREQILAVRQECIVGEPGKGTSYAGGFPRVDEGFVWPEKDDHPLSFVAQLECRAIGIEADGFLVFFHDNRHWGSSAADRGHAVVMHVQGQRQLGPDDLPVRVKPRFFGLGKKTLTPTTYRRVEIALRAGHSYPSLERELIDFHDDEALYEGYCELVAECEQSLQIGGFPLPVQSDDMERDCASIMKLGSASDWKLLLQLYEVGDMMWGDAGALYWFIYEEDLLARRFDRVWMIMQCH